MILSGIPLHLLLGMSSKNHSCDDQRYLGILENSCNCNCRKEYWNPSLNSFCRNHWKDNKWARTWWNHSVRAPHKVQLKIAAQLQKISPSPPKETNIYFKFLRSSQQMQQLPKRKDNKKFNVLSWNPGPSSLSPIYSSPAHLSSKLHCVKLNMLNLKAQH